MSHGISRICPIILCGGSGTRLWPASRASRPKQFVDLLGPRSTFQMAALRVTASDVFSRPAVILSSAARFIAAEQLAQVGAVADIILEPVQRDSATAVAVAACYAARRAPEAIVLIVASDHVIDDVDSFVASCEAAAEAARHGYIMTLGMAPDHPVTRYGYIRPGKPIEGTGAFKVDRFVEKPDAQAARHYVEQGFLWNSGNLVFRADAMLEELGRLEPAVLAAARDALDYAVTDPDFIRLHEESFRLAPRISIDYAVMERTEQAGVVPASFAWSDIGTWETLWEASPRDEAGNCLRGNAVVKEARNSLVHGDGILATVVGLDDVVVVAKRDAVLVASRKRSDLVRDLVMSLRARRHPEASEHDRTDRPWGWFQRIDRGPGSQVRRIVVKPGGQLSLRKNPHAGHWVVLHGVAEVAADERVSFLRETEAFHIPAGVAHRLANPGPDPLELIEVRAGGDGGTSIEGDE